MPAAAAQRQSTGKTVAGTVSCTTSVGSLQINAATLVGVQTDKSNYTLDKRCSRTKASVRLTHRGLRSAAVVKAGCNQSPLACCAAPRRVVVRYRIGLADSGKPATATMAVWARRKRSSRLHEIGYVQWSRSRSTTSYSTKSCTSQ